ncbi:MAG: glycosyltransferase family 2 protein [Tepidisphaeraceae bacterium]|jgi:glycosyltransferase involved in cell wall biosynthesis
MRKPRIGILVVAYNAENHLRQTLHRIPAELRPKIEEVFVFDDASKDRTHEVGRELQDEWEGTHLTIYKNPVNLMYGGNQRQGYKYAIEKGFDIVVLLHGDGQYAPEVMQELLTPLETGQADMVMGSRMMVPGAALRGNMPPYKYYGNKILTWMENRLLGTNLTEFHSGYRAYSVNALRNIPLDALTNNWHFDTQIVLEFLKQGLRIREVPIPTYYGDEICHVNGIPYALNCVRSALGYCLFHRWRSHASLPAAPRPQEQPPTDIAPAEAAPAKTHP